MKRKPSPLKALQKAVDLAGGQGALADIIGKRQSHVSYWLNKKRECPAEMALPISKAVDGAVAPHDLRPDIYLAPDEAGAAE